MTITYPDPLPFRLRVLHALTDALKEITPANGFNTDLADFDPGDGYDKSRVYRGRAWFGEDDPIPMVSILEADISDEISGTPMNVGAGRYEWPLMVQGFVNDDPLNPTDPAYVLAADVVERLTTESRRKRSEDPTETDIFGIGTRGTNKLTGLRVGQPVVRPADDISAKAYFGLVVTLTTVEVGGAPYA